eukprot:368015-Pelagomonas_calceolata.AAC.1
MRMHACHASCPGPVHRCLPTPLGILFRPCTKHRGYCGPYLQQKFQACLNYKAFLRILYPQSVTASQSVQHHYNSLLESLSPEGNREASMGLMGSWKHAAQALPSAGLEGRFAPLLPMCQPILLPKGF